MSLLAPKNVLRIVFCLTLYFRIGLSQAATAEWRESLGGLSLSPLEPYNQASTFCDNLDIIAAIGNPSRNATTQSLWLHSFSALVGPSADKWQEMPSITVATSNNLVLTEYDTSSSEICKLLLLDPCGSDGLSADAWSIEIERIPASNSSSQLTATIVQVDLQPDSQVVSCLSYSGAPIQAVVSKPTGIYFLDTDSLSRIEIDNLRNGSDISTSVFAQLPENVTTSNNTRMAAVSASSIVVIGASERGVDGLKFVDIVVDLSSAKARTVPQSQATSAAECLVSFPYTNSDQYKKPSPGFEEESRLVLLESFSGDVRVTSFNSNRQLDPFECRGNPIRSFCTWVPSTGSPGVRTGTSCHVGQVSVNGIEESVLFVLGGNCNGKECNGNVWQLITLDRIWNQLGTVAPVPTSPPTDKPPLTTSPPLIGPGLNSGYILRIAIVVGGLIFLSYLVVRNSKIPRHEGLGGSRFRLMYGDDPATAVNPGLAQTTIDGLKVYSFGEEDPPEYDDGNSKGNNSNTASEDAADGTDDVEISVTVTPSNAKEVEPEAENAPVGLANLHHYEEGAAPECAICIMDFEAGDKVRRLPCKHDFHTTCVDEWFQKHRTCPMCKRDLSGTDDLPIPDENSQQQIIVVPTHGRMMGGLLFPGQQANPPGMDPDEVLARRIEAMERAQFLLAQHYSQHSNRSFRQNRSADRSGSTSGSNRRRNRSPPSDNTQPTMAAFASSTSQQQMVPSTNPTLPETSHSL